MTETKSKGWNMSFQDGESSTGDEAIELLRPLGSQPGEHPDGA